MNLEIEGKVVKVLEEISGESKYGRWIKQEFVIETDEKYPKKICFSAWGDTTDIIKNISPGSDVKVSFNPESREYNERWYTDLRAWKIEKNTNERTNESNDLPPFTEDDIPSEEEEDLPF